MSDLLTAITTPIPGENPCGANINYDTDFDLVKGEMGKMGGADYDKVLEAGLRILKEKSKDIRIAAFLSFVYLRNEQWEEFADIFEGLVKISAIDFDKLFPERENAKIMAFKWLAEARYNGLLAEKTPTAEAFAHITRLRAALTDLEKFLTQKYASNSPFPGGLLKVATTWESACKPKPVAEATTAAVSSGGAVSGAGGTAPAEPMDSPKQALGLIRKAAVFLIEKEPQKPLGYRLMRLCRWDVLEKAPPAENNKTQIAGPRPEQRAYFANLCNQSDWKTILDKGEKAFAGEAAHLWLDLQKYLARACKALGAGYETIHAVITQETGQLVKKIPTLMSLQFSDGSPFCDAETIEWIKTECQIGSESAPAALVSSAQTQDDEQLKEVNALVAANKIEQAVTLLHAAVRTAATQRENFIRSLFLATILLSARQPDIAAAILESLSQKISIYHLDEWEPDLAAEAWAGLFRVYSALRGQKPPAAQAALVEKQNAVLGNISRIDPKRALTLSL